MVTPQYILSVIVILLIQGITVKVYSEVSKMAVYKSSNPHSLTDTLKKQLETGENNFVEALENSLQQPREHPVKKKPH